MRKLTTNMLQALLHPRRNRRGVASLLLLLVLFSFTAELAHRHGQLLPLRVATTASFDSTQAADSSAKGSLAGDVCLLCQFQQQLAHGLLHAPPFTFRPLTAEVVAVASPGRCCPAADVPSPGRAPPTVSPA